MKNLFSALDLKKTNAHSITWTEMLRPCVMFITITAILWLTFIYNASAQDNQKPILSNKVTPLRLGLLPHWSSDLLLKRYRNLIVYLEKKLQRPVLVHTAPNFKTYIKRAAQGRYDLYLTAPHLAAYHESQNQHHRIARFKKSFHTVIAVEEYSPYEKLDDLRGKFITAPDLLAAGTLQGEVAFIKNGFNLTKDISIKYTPSHNNALYSLANKKSDAAIAGIPAFKIVSKATKLKKPLRILTRTPSIPHMMFMSPAHIPQEQIIKYQNALLSIHNDETGKAFLESVPFGTHGLTEITDKDMRDLSDFVRLLKQRL